MISLNNFPAKSFIDFFPNGELKIYNEQIKSLVNKNGNKFVWYKDDSKFSYIEDLFILKIFQNIVKSCTDIKSRLHIKYLPYSRMDRETGGQYFTLKEIANSINELDFEEVIIDEVHSDVSLTLIDNSRTILKSIDIALDYIKQYNYNKKFKVMFPDEGAMSRYFKYDKTDNFNSIDGFDGFLVGNKIRCRNTGKILDYYITTPNCELQHRIDTEAIYIIDDLCVYGGTFLEAYKYIKSISNGSIDFYLIVTHLEPCFYDGELFKSNVFKKVIATDSMLPFYPKDMENLTFVD